MSSAWTFANLSRIASVHNGMASFKSQITRANLSTSKINRQEGQAGTAKMTGDGSQFSRFPHGMTDIRSNKKLGKECEWRPWKLSPAKM